MGEAVRPDDHTYYTRIIEELIDRWYLDGSLWRDRAECRTAVHRMLRERAEREGKGKP